jgi:hypothetical protein
MDTAKQDPKQDPKEVKEPKKNPSESGVNIDDAQIEEPRDDAFRKSPQPAQPPKQRRKKA